MGTHRHLCLAPRARWEQLIPPPRSFQCGCPRRRLQHASGEKTVSETLAPPHRTAVSTWFRDDLNRYKAPESASGKSFCTD